MGKLNYTTAKINQFFASFINKIIDTSSLTNDNDHIPTSGAVKSALHWNLAGSVDNSDANWHDISLPSVGSIESILLVLDVAGGNFYASEETPAVLYQNSLYRYARVQANDSSNSAVAEFRASASANSAQAKLTSSTWSTATLHVFYR